MWGDNPRQSPCYSDACPGFGAFNPETLCENSWCSTGLVCAVDDATAVGIIHVVLVTCRCFLPLGQILDIFQMLLRQCWSWNHTFWTLLMPSMYAGTDALQWALVTLQKRRSVLGPVKWLHFSWNYFNPSTCSILCLYPWDGPQRYSWLLTWQ